MGRGESLYYFLSQLFLEMPFVKKPVKKIIKKRNFKKSGNRLSKRSSLVSLIKKISLKPTETKHTHNIAENIQLYHNVPFISYAHLNTSQGVSDENNGTSNFVCRVGDEVIARGLSYKFWFANKLDRPNVMYKIIFFKYQSSTAPTGSAPFNTQGTANYMIRDLDVEKFKIIKVVKFTIQTSGQKVISQDTFQGAEGHKSITVYIPLKNQKLKYENGSSVPRFVDYAFTVVAYDSYGTLTTDNICSYAVNRKFYFKDP